MTPPTFEHFRFMGDAEPLPAGTYVRLRLTTGTLILSVSPEGRLAVDTPVGEPRRVAVRTSIEDEAGQIQIGLE